jgi:hypothetical protein
LHSSLSCRPWFQRREQQGHQEIIIRKASQFDTLCTPVIPSIARIRSSLQSLEGGLLPGNGLDLDGMGHATTPKEERTTGFFGCFKESLFITQQNYFKFWLG